MAVEDFKVYTQDSGWVSLAQTLPQGTSEGQLLHWDGTQWAAASDGTADGQYLVWDDTAKRWEPGTHVTGNLPIYDSSEGPKVDGTDYGATVELSAPSDFQFQISTRDPTNAYNLDFVERLNVTHAGAFFSGEVVTPAVQTDSIKSASNFTVSTGGQTRLRVASTTDFYNDGRRVIVGAYAADYVGGTACGLGPGSTYYYSVGNNGLAILGDIIRFNANVKAGSQGFSWSMEADGAFTGAVGSTVETSYIKSSRYDVGNTEVCFVDGFILSISGNELLNVSTTDATFSVPVRTPTVKGLVDTDAQIALGSQAELKNGDGSAYAPLTSDSIPTKKYVDELIWVGTQAEYDALGIYDNKRLYCITD